jgi:hypothetical protein
MNKKNEKVTERLGLLANGSSRRWDIAVDETGRRNEWLMEIEGPQTYLVFRLRELKVIAAALRFLQEADEGNGAALRLGRFGSASASLMWDNEDFPRCFLIIGPRARSTLRVSLEGEDIEMFIEALQQVVKDLPESASQ